MQRTLVVLGLVIAAVGLGWPWISKLGLGRLPGDIRIETAHGVFYLPITTCILISALLTLVSWLLRR